MIILLGCTLSSDGTSHRNQEYQGRHINVKAPNYTDDSPSIPRVRLLHVDSETDHSSETQVRGWLTTITAYSDLYNRCPPMRQETMYFSLVQFFSKFMGMHADHAADGKKNHRIFSELKTEFGLLDLGTRQLIASSPEQMEFITDKAKEGTIQDAGGLEAWNALPQEDRDRLNLQTMNELKISFGQDVYDSMSESEQRRFNICLWGGCCMHKDLNATRGGAEGMKAWWKANPHLQGPILLANKDNAATLADAPSIAAETNSSQKRALAATESGGVKTTLLAGALFNHSNDKKGLQDNHVIFFETIKIGRSTRFPGTSTTRYGSNLDAAAELITYLGDYITLLEEVRDKKEKMNFNHLEQNLYNALQDAPTLTELCAMIMYALAISYPYASRVRGPGTENVNLLDLGPFHQEVKAHVAAIIANPDLLLAPDASFQTATLDGRPWHRPDALAAVQKLAPTLPHLRDVTVAFFTGCLPVWERFTAEFDEDGVIAGLSEEEKQDGFMPTTNDANEGILGQMREDKRKKPNSTTHAFSARAMFRRNNTQAYMDANFGEEHHTFILREHRKFDSSGVVKKKKAAVRDHITRTVTTRRAKKKILVDKRTAIATNAAKVVVVTDRASLAKYSKAQLEDQLAAHRLLDTAIPKDIPAKSNLKNNPQRLEHLLLAVERYLRVPGSSPSHLSDTD